MAAPRSPTAVVNAMNASLNAHGVARGTPNFNSRHTAADLYSNSKWPLPAGAGAGAAAAAAAAAPPTEDEVVSAINKAAEMEANAPGKKDAKDAAIALAGRLADGGRKVALQTAANAIDVAAGPAAAMTGGRRRGRKSRKATKKAKKSKKAIKKSKKSKKATKKTKKAKKSRKSKGRK